MTTTTASVEAKTFCVNHPQTETLLRCNKCGKPVCIKCVRLTPVGYRCNECLGIQRAGYYTSTSADYLIAALVGLVLGAVGGFGMGLLPGFWIVGIFVGPAAGGIVSEAIRRAISKRRGQYIWLAACIAIALGGLIGLVAPALFVALGRGALSQFAVLLPRLLFNIGFWIYLALALSTTYARLRV